MNISICGFGYVGGAIGHLCDKNNLKYNVYDVMPKSGGFSYYDSLENMVQTNESSNNCNIYFISVPTPSNTQGHCDTSIVEKVLSDLSRFVSKYSIVLIKSTVKPGTTRKFSDKYATKHLKIVFCPEFLREATFRDDMYNTGFSMFGLEYPNDVVMQENLRILFKNYLYKHNPELELYFRQYEICEIFKYTVNVFLATKVWFFNEVNEVCEKMNVDYKSLRELFPLDPRIGMSHTMVPGHDGKYGYGLGCLPKETRAFRRLQEELDIPSHIISAIVDRNEEFREKTN
jgi:UDPglucose 6-dehydrogenase